MAGDDSESRGVLASMRSVENSDANDNNYCDGYQKIMCFPLSYSDFETTQLYIKV